MVSSTLKLNNHKLGVYKGLELTVDIVVKFNIRSIPQKICKYVPSIEHALLYFFLDIGLSNGLMKTLHIKGGGA